MPRPLWTTITPGLAAALLAVTWGRHPGSIVLSLVAVTVIEVSRPWPSLASFIFLTIAP